MYIRVYIYIYKESVSDACHGIARQPLMRRIFGVDLNRNALRFWDKDVDDISQARMSHIIYCDKQRNVASV